ncbi:amino acid adenylation domain-containing protein, partial [Bacillus spizizenii]|nr:amino acid adenylation domain-containing protein [Bacillus spizizenii]
MNTSKKLIFQGSTNEDCSEIRKEIFIIDENLTSMLKAVAESNHITLSALVQAAWGVLLQKYNNVTDVVFGAVISGRQGEVKGIEKMVGLFINAVPLRVKGERDTKFIELAKQVNRDFIKANTSYGYSSLADIQALTKIKGKLINHILVYENYPVDERFKKFDDNSNRIRITDMEVFEQTNYDFGVVIIPEDKIKVEITYNDLVYGSEMINRVGKNLCYILTQAAQKPAIELKDISSVSKEEQEMLHLFNKISASPYKINKSIQELFEEQAEKTPNQTALVFDDKQLTYQELNEKANQLARILADKGIGKNSITGLMIRPSEYSIIGMLGILKTGSAFLPIDDESPVNRINHILKDSLVSFIVTDSSLITRKDIAGECLDITNESLYNHKEVENLNIRYELDDEVYVIYTSGTSGMPKGVRVRNQSLTNYVLWAGEQIQIDSESRSLVTSKYSFDLCYTSIFPALTNGGQVHLIDKEVYLNSFTLIKYIQENRITYLKMTPTLFSTFMDYIDMFKSCTDLKVIILGGESLNICNVKKLVENCQWIKFMNHYGPTESTIGCIGHYIDQNQIQHCDRYNIIGKPIYGTHIYIVDHLNKIVPIGAPGEICVSGIGLASGYLNKEELTNEKFITDPFNAETKMYKTGDLGRWLPDGNIEFIGRIDHQVKIRGFRIETREVENQLVHLDGIKEAVVVARGNDTQKYLCAYITADKEIINAEVKEKLAKTLPAYMIPSFVTRMQELPLTPNGKIDRKALPEPELNKVSDFQYEAPRNETENQLVSIWKEILGKNNPISINENFFEMGGHSLTAAFTISRIRKE